MQSKESWRNSNLPFSIIPNRSCPKWTVSWRWMWRIRSLVRSATTLSPIDVYEYRQTNTYRLLRNTGLSHGRPGLGNMLFCTQIHAGHQYRRGDLPEP